MAWKVAGELVSPKNMTLGSVFSQLPMTIFCWFPPDKDDTLDLHRTASLDFAVVLDGEIHAVLDDEETLMRAGEGLIQRHPLERRAFFERRAVALRQLGDRAGRDFAGGKVEELGHHSGRGKHRRPQRLNG